MDICGVRDDGAVSDGRERRQRRTFDGFMSVDVLVADTAAMYPDCPRTTLSSNNAARGILIRLPRKSGAQRGVRAQFLPTLHKHKTVWSYDYGPTRRGAWDRAMVAKGAMVAMGKVMLVD